MNEMHEEQGQMSIWDPISVEAGQCVSWTLGSFSVYAERHEHEWHTLTVLQDRNLLSGGNYCCVFSMHAVKPLSSDWKHYLVREGNRADPVPVMPDRPVVIRPDRALTLLPGEYAQFFVGIPVWFRLLVGTETLKKQLFEQPISILLNTWFGDPVNGELCYALATRLYHDHKQIHSAPAHALCPLFIKNESETDLQFERICLHVENLSVFKSSTRLWTNAVTVIFKGTDQSTQIQISKAAPDFEKHIEPVCNSRQAVESWYIKKTFSMLKYFTGFEKSV